MFAILSYTLLGLCCTAATGWGFSQAWANNSSLPDLVAATVFSGLVLGAAFTAPAVAALSAVFWLFGWSM